MGNRLISEHEILWDELSSSWTSSEILCLHQNIQNGITYDVTESDSHEVKKYPKVFTDDNHVNALASYTKIRLNNIHHVMFTNIRRSTIIRKYERDKARISYNIIIGDYNDQSYDITNVYVF